MRQINPFDIFNENRLIVPSKYWVGVDLEDGGTWQYRIIDMTPGPATEIIGEDVIGRRLTFDIKDLADPTIHVYCL